MFALPSNIKQYAFEGKKDLTVTKFNYNMLLFSFFHTNNYRVKEVFARYVSIKLKRKTPENKRAENKCL